MKGRGHRPGGFTGRRQASRQAEDAKPFERGLSETVSWYRDREDWWRPVKEKDAAYREYYRKQYGDRLATSSATAKEPAGHR